MQSRVAKTSEVHRWNRDRTGHRRILNNGLLFSGRSPRGFVLLSVHVAYISRPTHKFITRLINANKTGSHALSFQRTRLDQFPNITGIFHRVEPIPLVPCHLRVCDSSDISLGTVARSGRQTRFSYPPFKLLATRNLGERRINYSC